jgi:hypothetical protein
LQLEADTLLLPTLLIAKTDKALLVNDFSPRSLEPIREVKLKKEELGNTLTTNQY